MKANSLPMIMRDEPERRKRVWLVEASVQRFGQSGQGLGVQVTYIPCVSVGPVCDEASLGFGGQFHGETLRSKGVCPKIPDQKMCEFEHINKRIRRSKNAASGGYPVA